MADTLFMSTVEYNITKYKGVEGSGKRQKLFIIFIQKISGNSVTINPYINISGGYLGGKY